MSEPSSPLLFTANKSNPLITTATQAFPYIWISIHASSFLGFLEWAASSCTDTVGETLIVPESAVFQDEPTSRLADATPTFALVAVTPHPTRCVEVSVKAKFLLMRNKIRVTRVHVFRRRRNLLLMKGSIEIRRITQISVV
jgi:hypothetical protein